MDSSDQKNLSRPGTSLDIQPRRSEARDSQEAFKLVQSYTTDVFGRVNRVENIALILEHAVFALSLADSYDNLFALAAFYDYPNIHNVSQSDWDQTWWNDTFKIPDVNAINTLFLHLFVAHPDYSEGCAKEVINAAFKTLPEVNQILLCVPNNVQPEIALSKYFTPISTKHDKSDSLSTVFGCYRKDHFPSLFIRTARVQDNDDLAPLFNQYNDILKQTYGDYFVAELIESQDDDNKAFVAEADGYAVGFMSVSKEVNINVLNEVYQLAAFHGLREAHSDDVWNEESGNNPTIDDQFSSIDATAVYEDAKGNSFIEQSSDTLENRRVSDMHQTTTDNNRLNNFKRQTTADEGKENRISLDSDLEIDNKAENENDHAITDQTVNNTDVQLIDTSAYRAKMTKAQLAAEDPSKFIRPSIASTAPKFFGRPKAFAIQLFCINELYEKRSYDFLKKAFDSFPDRDYCIISIPHMVPEFPLLHSFIRIPPRINLPNIQELYMFHRAGLLRNIEIKKATEDNLETIKKFVQHLSSREYIIQDFLEAVRSRKRRVKTK
ncbi:unnamed protein product [Didymodactylos carnosus]|uniref:Cilia- and flagella-associated protein 61 N-terminal domain-containing protein n=1 Tax=Didymodactylos carnosus TaxID=1234261 RepID=A0A8S2DHH8_9BILA|nr:unnamed protein product [Didymodactylos carnosus]CAF3715672.1 unnamed protein product [Didymodactylos carnosus]